MTDDPTLIEALEPTLWNAGVTAHVELTGEVVVEVLAPDPMPLTPVDLIQPYSI